MEFHPEYKAEERGNQNLVIHKNLLTASVLTKEKFQ